MKSVKFKRKEKFFFKGDIAVSVIPSLHGLGYDNTENEVFFSSLLFKSLNFEWVYMLLLVCSNIISF